MSVCPIFVSPHPEPDRKDLHIRKLRINGTVQERALVGAELALQPLLGQSLQLLLGHVVEIDLTQT